MKPRVAFVCVHNSCRSQIAEALGHALAGDAFESYSAGTALKAAINPDAVRLMKQLYGIDMEKSQRPKLLADIPAVDVVITMESLLVDDLGADSLDAIDIVMSVEDTFKVEVPDEIIEKIETVGDIVNYIEDHI